MRVLVSGPGPGCVGATLVERGVRESISYSVSLQVYNSSLACEGVTVSGCCARTMQSSSC